MLASKGSYAVRHTLQCGQWDSAQLSRKVLVKKGQMKLTLPFPLLRPPSSFLKEEARAVAVISNLR
jgi:hypothetical protein